MTGLEHERAIGILDPSPPPLHVGNKQIADRPSREAERSQRFGNSPVDTSQG